MGLEFKNYIFLRLFVFFPWRGSEMLVVDPIEKKDRAVLYFRAVGGSRREEEEEEEVDNNPQGALLLQKRGALSGR